MKYLLLVFTLCLASFNQASELLSDEAMGDVMATSGNVLDVLGSPGAGNVKVSTAQKVSPEAKDTQLQVIDTESMREKQLDQLRLKGQMSDQNNQSPSHIEQDIVKQPLPDGNVTITYRPDNNQTAASVQGQSLVVQQNVQVDSININQLRDQPSAPPRGDYSYQNINVISTTAIQLH